MTEIIRKIEYLKFNSNFQGANELNLEMIIRPCWNMCRLCEI